MVGGGESFMCPTVAYHSVAKTWANKRDGTPVLYTVAPTNNLVASECDDNCAWCVCVVCVWGLQYAVARGPPADCCARGAVCRRRMAFA